MQELVRVCVYIYIYCVISQVTDYQDKRDKCHPRQVNGSATQSVSFYPNSRLLALDDSVICQLGNRGPRRDRIHVAYNENKSDYASFMHGILNTLPDNQFLLNFSPIDIRTRYN